MQAEDRPDLWDQHREMFEYVGLSRQMHVVIGVAVFSNANRNPVMAIAPVFSNDGAMEMCSKNFRVFGEWEF